MILPKRIISLNGCDKNKYFIASDLHLGHANIINKYCSRPFENTDVMDETIIENWNNTVGKDDIVFFLGDFCFWKNYRKDSSPSVNYRKRLNGYIIFIRGNHDKFVDFSAFDEVYDDLIIQDMHSMDLIYLCHYPILDNRFRYFEDFFKLNPNILYLHGHVHNNPEFKPFYNSFNCSIENINYKPILLSEAIENAKKNQFMKFTGGI
jgi:calcineurin-like phosphoesterase family protein